MINRISSILSQPSAYRVFIRMVGTQSPRNKFLAEYVRPVQGEKVLDLGCGPADILAWMPGVNYTGLDISPEYIDAAKARYGDRGRFLCNDVGMTTLEQESGTFDLVLAKGVIHHLDDVRAAKLFELARRSLKANGRLITFDGCYVTGQSRMAAWLLSRDRGKFVRSQPEYLRLASATFAKVECFIRHDLLRIPYTHLIMRCGGLLESAASAGGNHGT